MAIAYHHAVPAKQGFVVERGGPSVHLEDHFGDAELLRRCWPIVGTPIKQLALNLGGFHCFVAWKLDTKQIADLWLKWRMII
ncbi:hypothetical protein DLJ82_6161 (plasmid) [Rhizobium leguminosarum]|uniref:Uncharacterized protein n=1 Tax=Rhizobium leguminosarum TaxID=384 RepID=A0A2Z4YUN0_RHILE|nr:hypothetical protein DLJ82_6161 [Rhizobium leguminosarum]